MADLQGQACTYQSERYIQGGKVYNRCVSMEGYGL